MTPEIEHVLEEVRGAWRFRWFALALAFVISMVGWAMVFALPDRYEAEARVFVDTRTALKPALQGLTTDQNVDAQINFVRQSLLEGPQLENIAKETGVLLPSVTDERARAQVLDSFSNRVALTVENAGNQGDERSTAGTIYEFHYEDLSRARALKVVDTLLSTFVEQTLGGKREGSENAQKFLESQIKDYEQRLSVAEDKLATFKKTNLGLMPSDQGGYFAQLQKETDDAKKAEIELSIAVSRREELSKQLHSDQAVSEAGATGPAVNGANAVGGDTLSRIQQTQAKLDELLLKYTDQHPDVIATRATLEELKKRRAAELESLRRGDAAAVAASGAGKQSRLPEHAARAQQGGRRDRSAEAGIGAASKHGRGSQSTAQQRTPGRGRVPAAQPRLRCEQGAVHRLARELPEGAARRARRQRRIGALRDRAAADGAGRAGLAEAHEIARARSGCWHWRPARVSPTGCIRLKPIVSSVRGANEMTTFPVLGVVNEAFPDPRSCAGCARISGASLRRQWGYWLPSSWCSR